MIPQVFCFAQKAFLHPTTPLFDSEVQTLKPRCMRALKRIFILCDHDMDGALNDGELNEFQIKCFNTPLQPPEIMGVKRVVKEKLPEGVNDLGLTLTGFLFLHALFIEKSRIETTWTVLRKFGYEDDLKFRDDCLSIPYKKASDQSVELTCEAVEFLKGIFSTYDDDRDGFLRNGELEDLFSTAPESPWDEAPYKDAVQRTPQRGISVSEFLCEIRAEMGIDAPFPLSMKERDLNDVFSRIVSAAQHPHLSVAETVLGRNKKRYRRLVHNTALCLSVGTAAIFIGLTAYRAYAARKNSSS